MGWEERTVYTEIQIIDYLAKWLHFIVGITWIGLLYYFNFVQTEYFKEADPGRPGGCLHQAGPKGVVVVPLGGHVHPAHRLGHARH